MSGAGSRQTANGDGWADLIDTLTMHPDVRRQVVRLLGLNRRCRLAPVLQDEACPLMSTTLDRLERTRQSRSDH